MKDGANIQRWRITAADEPYQGMQLHPAGEYVRYDEVFDYYPVRPLTDDEAAALRSEMRQWWGVPSGRDEILVRVSVLIDDAVRKERAAPVPPERIQAAAHTYATEAARIAAAAWARGFRATVGKKAPKHVVDGYEQQFREQYYESMRDAYLVATRETVKMQRGDFTPEPWTD